MVNHTQALTSSPSYYRGQYGIAETSRMFGMFQWAKQRKIITLCSLQHWSNGPIAMTCPEFVTEQGPRRRIIGWVEYKEGSSRKRLIGKCKQVEHNEDDRRELQERSGRQDTARRYTPRKPVTEGWTNVDLPVTRRGIVLDPFAGTGTTGEVAIKLGRNFICIELYDEYASIAEQRCREAAALRSRYESGRESKLSVVGCERNDQLGGSPCDPGNNRDAQDVSITPPSRFSLPHSM